MNTANNTPANIGPVQVLLRYDHSKQQPVVFLRDSIAGDQIVSWSQGQETVTPLAYYHHTAPLADKDEKRLAAYYAQQTGRALEAVNINHRLPRTPRARVNLPAPAATTAELLSKMTPEQLAALAQAFPALAPLAQAATPAAATNGSPALTLVHPAPAATPAPAKAPAGKRLSKKAKRSEAAKKAAATRAANRAKTIEAQPAPAGPQGQLPEAGLTPTAPAGMGNLTPEQEAAIATFAQGLQQAGAVDKAGQAVKVDPVAQPAAPSVSQATPADVMAEIVKLREEFAGRLDSVLARLAPAAGTPEKN